ncbi:MAG TPA: phospholipid carrier-dependent glycosyltransferase, partial [Novosphingobium sp.]|nr:phospholipid carrier-dependent glycosyltransferase [Novosphingobium sp.]
MIIAPAPGQVLRPRDPLAWHVGIAAAFALLAFWHLGTPSRLYFDEIHYVPAARAMLAGKMANPEHPLLAKTLIAQAIAALGDKPWVWRLPSAIMGVLGLFAFGRALWWAGQARPGGGRLASIGGMALLASDFAWFIQSRIAMLDMTMAALGMVALWMLAAALAQRPDAPTTARRWRLAVAGASFGLGIGAKWSLLPVWLAATGGVLAWRLWQQARHARNLPLPGMPVAEILFWLLSVPLMAYWATFWPAFHYATGAISPAGMVPWHQYMLQLQASVIKHHPYQSVWYQWVVNWRAIWYLYEVVDGAQRGIVLIGNPVTMIAGLAALGWCGW